MADLSRAAKDLHGKPAQSHIDGQVHSTQWFSTGDVMTPTKVQ